MTQAPPSDFLAALKDLLGPMGWTDDPVRLEEHSTGFRAFMSGETPLVAMPASTEEAAALVKLCGKHGVAITPQGGNTGLVDGGLVAAARGRDAQLDAQPSPVDGAGF